MSAAGYELQSFDHQDISSNASENDSPDIAALIMQLAENIDTINTKRVKSYRLEHEQWLAHGLREELEYALELYREGDYGACMKVIQAVMQDIDHSFDDSHLDEAKAIIVQCGARAMTLWGLKSA